MHRLYWHSKDFQRYFFTYIALFVCVFLVGISIFSAAMRKERKEANEKSFLAESQKVRDVLDDIWEVGSEVSNVLQNSIWVQKFTSESKIFENEFGPMEKQDISVNLTALCSLNSALRDIAVLYPQKDLVVTSSGWFSVSEYENYLQRKLQLPANLVTEHLLNVPGCEGPLKPSNFAFHNADYLVYVQQLDILTPPRAIAISCFDKAAMQKLLQQVCGEQVTQLLVKDWNGQPIWQVDFQQTSAPTQTCSTSSQSMLVTYDLTCEDAPIPFAQSAWNYVLVLVLAMLGILAAYVLASIQYQPLGNLIQKINKKVKGKNEQQDIDTLATCVGRLYDDHTNMENTIAAYRYALREQTNAQLLRGYFNSDQQSVPSSCNYWYVVVVFRHQPGNPDNETEDTRIHLEFLLTLKKSLQTIKCGQSHCELVENIDECTAVIAEFPSLPDEDIAMELAQPLYDALIEEDIECSVFVARARRGLTGISAAYQEIKESMREKKGICGIQFANPNMEYYYPLDWETQLVRAIREGSEKRAQAILQQLYEENQRLGLSYTLICRVATLLYETMRRIILEEKLPVQMFLKMEEPQHGMTLEQAFDRARNTVNTLCEQIMQKKQQAATNVNRSLVSYVNEHLHDPDLSLNLLSDHFGVSNASVSRIFKNTVGQNFYNYITEKRMAKAKELLVLKGYCPREIATEIGYDNKYSFKRAFQRTYGITPRDFLEKEGKNAR